MKKTVSTEEYNDAWRFLINLEQRKLDLKKQRRLQCTKIEVELSSKRRLTQNILSPRIKNFPSSFSSNKKGDREKIEEINVVTSHGGFKYKEWTGIFWDVSKDEFYSSRRDISVGGKILGNTSSSKKIDLKPYLGGDSTLPLSKALPHDPGGLVLPVKMIRTLLPSEDFAKVPAKETDKKKEVTCHESQVTSREIDGSHVSQVTRLVVE